MKNQTYSYIYIPVYKMKQIYNPGADTAKWLVNRAGSTDTRVPARRKRGLKYAESEPGTCLSCVR